MPCRIIDLRIVTEVKPHELIAKLVERDGGTLPVAKAMKAPGFQPTLHKLSNGIVKSPSRATAERIAKHFHIPIDAIYDAKIAARVYREKFGLGLAGATEPPVPPPEPLAEAISVVAAELATASVATRKAVGSLLGSLAEDPSSASEISAQIRSLLKTAKRLVSNGE